MHVVGADLLQESQGTLKFILNDSGVIFFPANQQHSDIKSHGLSYQDNYKGNAVAGIITAERVEIRFHSSFSDERIRGIWSNLLQNPEIPKARLELLYYQGRKLL